MLQCWLVGPRPAGVGHSAIRAHRVRTPNPLIPIHQGLTWLGKIRLRAIVFVIGVPLAVMGAISLSPAWLTVPLVGVALAAVTMSLSKITSRLGEAVCLTCGHDLQGLPPGEHGVACPNCGGLNMPASAVTLARIDSAIETLEIDPILDREPAQAAPGEAGAGPAASRIG